MDILKESKNSFFFKNNITLPPNSIIYYLYKMGTATILFISEVEKIGIARNLPEVSKACETKCRP